MARRRIDLSELDDKRARQRVERYINDRAKNAQGSDGNQDPFVTEDDIRKRFKPADTAVDIFREFLEGKIGNNL